MAIGTDFPLLNELLNYGSSLAKRSTIHSTTFDLFGGARKEGSSFFMEGNVTMHKLVVQLLIDFYRWCSPVG